jgi:putative hydrolase of the HAD superfamily
MIRAILFDLDGTLLDRNAGHRRYCLDLLNRHPHIRGNFRPGDDLRFLMGRPDRDRHSFARRVTKAFPELGVSDQLAADYAHRIPTFIEPDARIELLLNELKGQYALGVISNGDDKLQRAKLNAAGLLHLFDHVAISGGERAAKPSAVIFKRALAGVGTVPTEALFVGDDPLVDIAGAARAGIKTCWVTGGRIYPDHLVRPEHSIRFVHDLRRILP